MKPSNDKVEFGDFQTPPALARAVCDLLLRLGENPRTIVEPTAGRGTFLGAAAEVFPQASLKGWEINPTYVDEANRELAQRGASSRGSVVCHDFFTCDWDAQLGGITGNLLLLGNPPWVTNAGVAAINGSNLPTKANFHGLRGIAARTGKANFDISEWMLIRLLHALHGRSATVAMLCKTATARKFLRYAWKNEGHITTASLYRIDSALHFEAAVDACLLVVRTGESGPHEASIYESVTAPAPTGRLGLIGEDLVADVQNYRALQHLEGFCPFRWRSGIKHDCAAVMELKPAPDGTVENGEGDRFKLEPEYLYPLLKCSDLANGRITPARLVLVTQRFVGDDTVAIEKTPRLPGATSNLTPPGFSPAKVRSTEAAFHFHCLASANTRSRLGKSPSPACTNPHGSKSSALSPGGRSSSTIPATISRSSAKPMRGPSTRC